MAYYGKFWYPDADTKIGNINTALAQMASSFNDGDSVVRVTTLAALNAIGQSTAHPLGTLASLTAYNGGLASGATFVLTDTGSGVCWCLNSGNVSSMSAFISALSSNTHIGTVPGTSWRDGSTAQYGIWTGYRGQRDRLGGYETYVGRFTTGGAIGVNKGKTWTTHIPAGKLSGPPAGVFFSPNNQRLSFGLLASGMSATQFKVNLYNYSNATIGKNTLVWYVAFR